MGIKFDDSSSKEKAGRPPCDYDRASVLGKLSFSWMNPLIALGAKKVLKEQDMPELPKEDSARYLADRFQRQWDHERETRPQPRLWRALLLAFFPLSLWVYPCLFLSTSAKILQATVGIQNLVRLLDELERGSMNQVYVYASVIVGCGLVMLTVHHMVLFMGWRLGLAVRTALTAAIYRKSLRLPQSTFAANSLSSGYIVNLCSADVERFQLFCVYIPYLLLAPFEVSVMLYCGIRLIGLPFCMGMAVLFIIVPIQGLLARSLNTIGKRAATLTDQRIKLSKQAIEGARIIKMSGWELALYERIRGARAREIKLVLRAGLVRSIHEAVYFLCPAVAGAATFISASMMLIDLSPGIVFSTLTLFNILQWDLVNFASKAMQTLSEVLISLPRLESFFLLPETGPLSLPLFPDYLPSEAVQVRPPVGGIRTSALSASWATKGPAVLHNVSLHILPGQLVGLVGAVASGKSSLLLSLMRELKFSVHSTLAVQGTVAFAPQEPFIITGSLRDNVLMGRPFDAKRYRDVLRACCMLKDVRGMTHGDQTILADRGVNLSGGQKARLGLARTVYGDADIYLIDDAFSALDPKVGRRVFRRVICGLLASKTRVLATHQIQYFAGKEVDSILLLKNGSVRAAMTSLCELREQEFFSLSSSHSSNLLGGGGRSNTGGDWGADEGLHANWEDAAEEQDEEEEEDGDEDDEGLAFIGHSREKSTAESIVAGEDQADGGVSPAVWRQYIASVGGVRWVLFVCVLFVLAQASHIGTSVWLSYWCDLPLPDQHRPFYISVYVLLVVLVAIFAILRAFFTYRSLIQGSQVLHDTMLFRILRAPSTFYDANPTGRILNRATKDVQFCDTFLPYVIYDFMQCTCTCVGVLGVVISVNPWLLLLLPPLSVLFYRLRARFLRTSREARRMESVARSPVFALLGEALEGLTTIRAVGVTERFEHLFFQRLDAYARPYFVFVGAGRHLGFRLDFLCWLMVLATTYTSLEAESKGTGAKAEFFGMSIMYVLQLAAIFQWAVRQSSEVENYIVAAERIIEYCNLPQEAPLESDPSLTPHSYWPQHGGIEFKGVEASYKPGARAMLRRLSFHAFPGNKVGIVGRSGAGKSTTVQVLFRLLEPTRGDMVIDGVSVLELGLHDLRKKLSVIPQVPFLFSGTVRENLDPLEEHTDMELWDSLEDVHMKEAVERLGGLHGAVSESGANLSLGERQLICLARAILQHNRILVLDEATANIDMRTDALIQATIRHKFANATVIAVAHRLQTIIDCDQVLVLSGGALVDGGHPHELLKKGSGAFVEMVKETGPESEALLREQAEQAWYRNRRRRLSQTSALVRHTWYGEDDDFSYGTLRDDFQDDFDEDTHDDEEEEDEEMYDEDEEGGEKGSEDTRAGENHRGSESSSYDAMVSPDEQDLLVLGTLGHQGGDHREEAPFMGPGRSDSDMCGVTVVETRGEATHESGGKQQEEEERQPPSVYSVYRDPQSPALHLHGPGAALFVDPQSPGFSFSRPSSPGVFPPPFKSAAFSMPPTPSFPMPHTPAFVMPRISPVKIPRPQQGGHKRPEEEDRGEEQRPTVLSERDAQGLV